MPRPTSDDATLNFSQFRGQIMMLYFYPRDNTPACTQMGQDFSNLHHGFTQGCAVVLGVSHASVRTHSNFKSKHKFPFERLADPNEIPCRLYDAIQKKKTYGREITGIERSTFLIDKDGKLKQEWRKVRVRDHGGEVLGAVR